MSKVKLGRGSKDTREAVARFVLRPDGLRAQLRPYDGRGRARAFPGPSAAAARRRTPVAPVVDLRVPPGGEQRRAPRPEHGAGQPARCCAAPGASTSTSSTTTRSPTTRVARLESLKVLESLDQVLNVLEQVAAGRATQLPLRRALRPRAVPGSALRGPLRPVAGRPVCRRSSTRTCCPWTRTSRAGAGGIDGGRPRHRRLSGTIATRAAPQLGKAQRTPTTGERASEPAVVPGSGNLGLLYLREPARLTLEELDLRAGRAGPWPRPAPGRRLRRRA